MRLLIAEDNPEHRRLILSVLTRSRPGVDASVTTNREEFLRSVRDQRFDCVLLDYSLGPSTAPELLKEAGLCIAGTPVLVISANSEQGVVIESLRMGAADFLPKEQMVDASTLWEHIDRAVECAAGKTSRRRRTHERLRTLQRAASVDALTGLYNRGFATRVLASGRLRRDRRAQTSFVLLDIDHFKLANDRHGHDAGDEVLRRVADVLTRSAEDGDIMVRWGGEEFLAIKPSDSLAEAWAWADELRGRLERTPFEAAGATIAITASIGVATVPTGELCEATVVLSDRALYLAKDNGRNQVCTWPMVRALDAAHQVQSAPGVTPDQRVSRLLQSLSGSLGAVHREHLGAHSALVREFAGKIGRTMRLSGHDLAVLGPAARLHDIGKVAIPEEILAKPGPLTASEKRLVDEHSKTGSELALALGADAEVAGVILGHHGRFDAAPGETATAGAERTLGSIVTVADAIAAMVVDRSYAPKRGLGEAIAEVRLHRGRQFDPRVVDCIDCESLSPAA